MDSCTVQTGLPFGVSVGITFKASHGCQPTATETAGSDLLAGRYARRHSLPLA